MPKEFSVDLRWRVVYLYYDDLSTVDIANTLHMSKSIVNKIIKRYNRWVCVENPFKAALERNEIIRAHYLATIGEHYTRNQLIFLNESAKVERSLTRLYGYSPKNIRAQKKVAFIRGKRYTILPALTLEGFVAVDIFEGSCDRKKFVDFVLDQVVPIMNPYPGDNSVIVMDNAKIHHDNELVVLLEELGCRVVFLPPYSPNYNTIETAFSTIKSWIRHNHDFMEACNDPVYALLVACSQITPQMAQSYFDASIYV
ncbi:hypothetical protein RclHR1_18430004 [Rhizophagus clarus]|uniref:Tc1-like transposase DDE domain-containing protein n=1 Tax=Rhizophagus clarus TaxID=94130 RepID=A0A2Z6R0Y1_9GLOM|nr:hypothetical protein RclHR1_18430004 [Rhizophagus clarus]